MLHRLFWQPQITKILADGGTKSGKTSGCVNCCVQYMPLYPGVRILFGHLDLSSLNSSLLFHLAMQVPEMVELENGRLLKIREDNHQLQRITIRIPNLIHKVRGYTAQIDYRPLDPGKKLEQRLMISGSGYGIAVLDQIELLGPSVVHAVMTRLDQPPFKLLQTANPEEDAWWHEQYIEPKEDTFESEEEAAQYARVQMNLRDNPHADPRYEEGLRRSLPPDLLSRLLDGSYERIKGLIFGPGVFDFRTNVVSEGPIPSDALVYEFCDYGFKDPCAIQWWVETTKGELILWDTLTLRLCTGPEIAQQVLKKRWELLTGRSGQDVWLHRGPVPQFVASVWGTDIGRAESTGRTPKHELMSYEAPNGDRLIPVVATSKGLVQKFVNKSRAEIAVARFREGVAKVNTRCREWFDQRSRFVWEDNEPKFFRSMNADGTVKDHLDHMGATILGFGWWSSQQPAKVSQRIIGPRDEYRVTDVQAEYDPAARFRCKY